MCLATYKTLFRPVVVRSTILLCAILAGATWPVAAGGGEAEDFQSLLTQWAARRDGSPLRGAASGTTTVPAGAANNLRAMLPGRPTTDVPEKDYISESRVEALLDPSAGHAKLLNSREIFSIGAVRYRFRREVTTTLWDGDRWQVYRRGDETDEDATDAGEDEVDGGGNRDGVAGEGAPTLISGTEQHGALAPDPATYPLLFHMGCFRPDVMGPRFGLGPLPSRDSHRAVGHTEKDGLKLVIVRTTPEGRGRVYEEVWADPTRDGAIARFSRHDSSGIRLDISIEHELREATWEPVWWRVKVYGRGDKVIRSDDFRLDHLQLDAAVLTEEFRLPLREEWQVRDYGRGLKPIAPMPDMILERVVPPPAPAGAAPAAPRVKAELRRFLPYLAILIGGVLAVGTIYWAMTRRR